jgi:hypothetical protein
MRAKYKIIEREKGFACYKRHWFFWWKPAVTWRGLPQVYWFSTFKVALEELCKEEDIDWNNDVIKLNIELLDKNQLNK